MKQTKPLNNPFLLSGYVSPEYFCDREIETEKIISALHNGRNITLISPRRMGKTGLIYHAFNRIKATEKSHCYYVDLYQSDSLATLVKKLGETVLGTLDSHVEQIMKKVSTFFKSLRPSVSFNPITGEPDFSLDIQPETAERSLAEIFCYMEQTEEPCYIAFDEFQTVAEYADNHVEALLRSHIQHLHNVQFIFSGSQKNMIENMFTSANRPFYQSTQIMHLAAINMETYFGFAATKLHWHGQELNSDAFKTLYDELFGHTWYIQMLLNRLYDMGVKEITSEQIMQTIADVVKENEATYQTFLRLITPSQAKVLEAVASEREVASIQSQAFLTSYHLGASSTVKSAVNALIQKELLLETNGSYSVYDRFFSIWLKARQ